MDNSNQTHQPDHNHSLLEGLFQLTVSGAADSQDFALIDQEVYTRLLETYLPADPR